MLYITKDQSNSDKSKGLNQLAMLFDDWKAAAKQDEVDSKPKEPEADFLDGEYDEILTGQ